MDTIKAYIDFYPEVDGIMFRKSVFIFLSNSAAKDIAHLTLSFDKQVKDRNEFDLKLFQTEIQNSIYHNKGKFFLYIRAYLNKFIIKLLKFCRREWKRFMACFDNRQLFDWLLYSVFAIGKRPHSELY